MDETNAALGSRIRTLRIQRQLSQAALAEAIGVSYQQIQKYERGVDRVTVATLITIAGRLGCSIAELIGETGDGPCGERSGLLATRGAREFLDVCSKIRDAELRQKLQELLAHVVSPTAVCRDLGESPATFDD